MTKKEVENMLDALLSLLNPILALLSTLLGSVLGLLL